MRRREYITLLHFFSPAQLAAWGSLIVLKLVSIPLRYTLFFYFFLFPLSLAFSVDNQLTDLGELASIDSCCLASSPRLLLHRTGFGHNVCCLAPEEKNCTSKAIFFFFFFWHPVISIKRRMNGKERKKSNTELARLLCGHFSTTVSVYSTFWQFHWRAGGQQSTLCRLLYTACWKMTGY